MQFNTPHSHRRIRFRPGKAGSVVMALFISALLAQGTAAQDSVRERLASVYVQAAREIVGSEVLGVPQLELAVELMQQAVDLDPTDVDIRRTLLRIAELAEDHELVRSVAADLAQLDPSNESIRLRRLNDALERYQSAEGRIAAYQRLLAEDTVKRIDPAIASRLAYDAHLLEWRIGNREHADWLALATELDQSNKSAAAKAAGYFQAKLDDPFATTELLLNLVVADPTDVKNQLTLARHLLKYGAYEGAATLYRMALDSYESIGRLAMDDLIADQALAEWGAGNRIVAHTIVTTRKQFWNRVRLEKIKRENPYITPEQRHLIESTFPSTLLAIQIAMMDIEGDPEVGDAVQRFLVEFDNARKSAGEDMTAMGHLEMVITEAWMLLWFTDRVDTAEEVVQSAIKAHPLTPEAQAKFDGWIAYRRNDLDTAMSRLRETKHDDPAALVGMALVHEAKGESRESARRFLEAWRAAPGTSIGLWARDRLAMILGKDVPVDDLAARMNGLITSVPRSLWRIGRDPSRIISLTIESVNDRYSVFEPVLMRLKITNRTSIPIGIGEDGPLRPIVMIEPHMTVAGTSREAQPFLIELDRKLRLDPMETVEIIVDLRRFTVGQYFDVAAIQGVTFELTATLNPVLKMDRRLIVEPGVMGMQRRSGLVRVDGIDIDTTWIEDTTAAIVEPDTPSDVALVPLLAQIVAQFAGATVENDAVTRMIRDAEIVLPQTFARLDPYAQAWVLHAMGSQAAVLEPIRELARQSTEPIVQITYLLTQVNDPSDPMIFAAARSEDPRVKRIGKLFLSIGGVADPSSGQATQPTDDS